MRHDGNGGRKSASDFSRFPVSASVPYTIYMSRMKLNALTKPARIATEPVLSLPKGPALSLPKGPALSLPKGFVSSFFDKKLPVLALLLDITFETNTLAGT